MTYEFPHAKLKIAVEEAVTAYLADPTSQTSDTIGSVFCHVADVLLNEDVYKETRDYARHAAAIDEVCDKYFDAAYPHHKL